MAVTVTFNNVVVEGDFQTNTFELTNQLSPDALGLSNGGFVCAYNNTSLTNGVITLNFYDAQRNVVGTYESANADVNTDAVGQPKLAQLDNGNVLVVWDDDNTTDSGAGLRGSIFSSTGDVVSLDIDLSALDNLIPFASVDVCALEAGGFVISYEFSGDIFQRVYDPAGVQQGGFTVVNTELTGTQTDSQITVLADGAYAIIWTDTNPADQLVKGRIFEANGDSRTDELNFSPGIGDNTQPSIAALRNGGMAVVYTDTGWNEGGTGTGAGVSLHIVQADGDVGAAIHVNTSSAADEADADVTVLSNGFIAVTWTFPFSATDKDVYGRVFTQNGVPVTAQFEIAAGGNDEWLSAVSSLGDGRFITSWQDETLDSSMGSIESQVNEIRRTIVGDAAADSFTGDGLRDIISGMDGNDTLKGGAGNDTVDGGDQNDSIDGGNGNDLLQGAFLTDTINGGDGADLIYANTKATPQGSSYGDLIDGGNGEDRVQGSLGADTVTGGEHADNLFGGGGDDELTGDRGADTIKGQSGADTLEGGYDGDTVNGGVGDDVLYAAYADNLDISTISDLLNGGNGNDTAHGSFGGDRIFGLGGKDALNGRAGADSIDGGDGKDFLRGGSGVDQLTGGAERDVFIFDHAGETAAGFADLITDLELIDVISLIGIDAKASKDGDQKFELVSSFTGAEGELVVDYHVVGPYAGLTTIQGDVDGDALADFIITATGDLETFDNFAL